MCMFEYFANIIFLTFLCRNKAVADGAISFYLDHRVSARVAKHTYGIECYTQYDPQDLQHRSRSNTVFTQSSGYRYIPRAFDSILKKVRANNGQLLDTVLSIVLQGTRTSEDKEFRRSYYRVYKNADHCGTILEDITSYHGTAEDPQWTDVEPGEHYLLLSFSLRFVDETRDVFDTLHCESRHVTNS
jgi:hypothetical protein